MTSKTANGIETATRTNKEPTMTVKTAQKKTDSSAQAKEANTMKTANTVTTPSANPTTGSGVALQLQAIEQACGYGDPLTDVDRKTSIALVHRVPETIIDRVVTLAVRQKGMVAGIAFDPTAARAALAEADDADAVATAAAMLARRAQDQSIRLRSGVANDVTAVRTSLRGYARTKAGAGLAQENDEIRSLARQHKAVGKAQRTRGGNAAKAEMEGTSGANAPPTVSPPPEAQATVTPSSAPQAVVVKS